MIIPFINFAGKAGEAIAFYETIFDVKNKQVFYYRDMPDDMKKHFSREMDNFVMHAEMTINDIEVWFGDTTQDVIAGDMVTLAVPFASQDKLRATFDGLKADGEVLMELAKTFYSPLFGTVQDKFGVIWHLICR